MNYGLIKMNQLTTQKYTVLKKNKKFLVYGGSSSPETKNLLPHSV